MTARSDAAEELRTLLVALSGGGPIRLAVPPAATGEPRGDVVRADRELIALDLECLRRVQTAPDDLAVCAEAVSAWAWASLTELQRVDGAGYAGRWEALTTVALLLPVERRPRGPRLRLVRDGGDS
jgi:hypothetical protein